MKNRRKAGRLKRQDKNRIGFYFRVSGIPRATTKRRVSLQLIYGKGERKHDPDAFWKSVLDALVHAGALKNDTDRWVEVAPVVYGRAERRETIITLEDL